MLSTPSYSQHRYIFLSNKKKVQILALIIMALEDSFVNNKGRTIWHSGGMGLGFFEKNSLFPCRCKKNVFNEA